MIGAALTNFGSLLFATDGWGDHWHGPWFLLFPLFWALVILGTVWIVRGRPPWRGRRAVERPEGGAEILERRFAEGEIGAEEYRDRRSTLEQGDR